MRPVHSDGSSTSKLASASHKYAGAVGIDMHAEQGFCVMAGTVQCLIKGETGAIADNYDFAPEDVLQSWLMTLRFKQLRGAFCINLSSMTIGSAMPVGRCNGALDFSVVTSSLSASRQSR